MLYLFRFAETRRDVQRGKLRRDLEMMLRAFLPEVRLDTALADRLIVEAATDARTSLVKLHDVVSLSPCRRCSLDELSDAMLALAHPGARSARSGAAVVTAHHGRSVPLGRDRALRWSLPAQGRWRRARLFSFN